MSVRIQHVFFDLDGTLIDTEKAAALAVEDAFSGWGISVTREDAQFVTGKTWETAFQFLFKKYPLKLNLNQAREEILRRYREGLEKNLEVIPGAVAAVQALAPHHPLALVSGSFRSEILWALKKLKIDHHFEVILGAEDYPQSKPAPDGYLKALELFNARPRETLIFEDSHAGIASGRAAGCWVVAITVSNHTNQDTSASHHQIQDLSGVNPDWIRKKLSPILGSQLSPA